jgi:hypothetical protein
MTDPQKDEVLSDPFAELDPIHQIDALRQRLDAIDIEMRRAGFELEVRLRALETALGAIHAATRDAILILKRAADG